MAMICRTNCIGRPSHSSSIRKTAPFVPKLIEAVESQGISILYYARSNGELADSIVQKPKETPDGPAYKSDNIILDENTVSGAVPQVTAVGNDFHNNHETRPLFIGETEGNTRIRELCKTNNGLWREGALPDNQFPITKDSLISVDVEVNLSHCQVSYTGKNDEGETVPFVAWALLGTTSETWSQRPSGNWK
ncbi:MAG: hypothetical protein LQ342_007094 [Letrouitia transgressa]|nr:MAG: hypothetical protein LQ342_007094 [Letrouitia transgressa]